MTLIRLSPQRPPLRWQLWFAAKVGLTAAALVASMTPPLTWAQGSDMRVAEDAARYSPDTSSDRTRRPTEQRRPASRRPVNPVPSADCLATGTCAPPTPRRRPPPRSENPLPERATISSPGLESAPAADDAPPGPTLLSTTCAASVGLRSITPALRQKLLALGASQKARDCARAVNKLSPLREQLRAAYENALPAEQTEHFAKAAADYVARCLGDNMLLDQGALTPDDESFLRAHTGFIVRRTGTAAQQALPVCQAARLGSLVVTAQHCIPMTSSSSGTESATPSAIAFSFFDRPVLYDLAPRLLNTASARHLDYAVLEIVGVPELREEVPPLVGKIELLADFYDLTANIYLRIVNRQTGDNSPDFRPAALVEHSTLCRPAYIAPDGIFLHACQTEAGLSGTPLFQRHDGRLVFVGLHNGVTEALEDPALAACAPGLPNYGVSVPPSALVGLQSR